MKLDIVDVIYGKRVHRIEKVEVHVDGLLPLNLPIRRFGICLYYFVSFGLFM